MAKTIKVLSEELNFYTQELTKLQNEYLKKIMQNDYYTSEILEKYIHKCLSRIENKQNDISSLIKKQ